MMIPNFQIFEAYVISDVKVWCQSYPSLLQALTSDFNVTDGVGFKNLEIRFLIILPY